MAAFTIKCLASFVFIFIYNYYYDKETADIYKYFNDGMVMARSISDNPLDYLRMLTGIDADAPHLSKYYSQMSSWFRPWEEPVYNDNRIVVRFNALIGIISGGYIGVHNIAANFLVFTGLIALYKFSLNKISKNKSALIFWGIFLFPSVLFWGSGILKESILLFAIGWFLLFTYKLKNKQFSAANMINVLFALFILVLLKAYIIFLLIPVLITFYLLENKNKYKAYIIPGYVVVFTVWTGFFIGLGFLFPDYNLMEIIANKQNSFVLFSQSVEAGSIITHRLMEPNIGSFLSFVPSGFWNTLTRPHIFDSTSPLIIFAALENILIWTMLILMLVFFNKDKILSPFFWFCISFVIITFVFVGMVTPLYGAIVRYKIPALPFLWIAFIYILDYNKIEKAKKLILNKLGYKQNY